MIVIDLENIKLPSLNSKYYKNFALKSEYKEFKEFLHCSCIQEKIEPPYKVIINCESYIDIDNFIKPIHDAIENRGVIDNDKNVLELHVYKTQIKRGMAGKLTVEVETIK